MKTKKLMRYDFHKKYEVLTEKEIMSKIIKQFPDLEFNNYERKNELLDIAFDFELDLSK